MSKPTGGGCMHVQTDFEGERDALFCTHAFTYIVIQTTGCLYPFASVQGRCVFVYSVTYGRKCPPVSLCYYTHRPGKLVVTQALTDRRAGKQGFECIRRAQLFMHWLPTRPKKASHKKGIVKNREKNSHWDLSGFEVKVALAYP